jgi:hypothetical protein
MNRLIHQLQLTAKMGNQFGNVHKTRPANGFVIETGCHNLRSLIRVIEEAGICWR